jgi:hypothetical protein
MRALAKILRMIGRSLTSPTYVPPRYFPPWYYFGPRYYSYRYPSRPGEGRDMSVRSAG